MEDLSDSKKNDVLPEFKTFLLEKKLVQEKKVFFYALWASKYFTYARMKADPNMSDWQIRQASDAIHELLLLLVQAGCSLNRNVLEQST